MSDLSLQTTQLRVWIDRIQTGDRAARDELIGKVQGRLERLARKMLRNFPRGGRWEDTDDLLQNTLVRLTRALEEIEIRSVREFFGLAALHMRRELTDLARRCPRLEAQFDSLPQPNAADASAPAFQPADPVSSSGEADLWSAIHQEVEKLPTLEREVVGLVYYHGHTQAEAAAILNLSERHVRRCWQAACLHLHEALKGQLPNAAD